MREDQPDDLRIRILEQVLDVIVHVYSKSQPSGEIKTIRFLNSATTWDDVTALKVNIKGHNYRGMTMLGTELEHKILTPFVNTSMARPLLVMIITDGDVSA